MHELRLQEQLCDVVLSVSGTKFHAHKVTNGLQIPSTVWPTVNFNVAVQVNSFVSDGSLTRVY